MIPINYRSLIQDTACARDLVCSPLRLKADGAFCTRDAKPNPTFLLGQLLLLLLLLTFFSLLAWVALSFFLSNLLYLPLTVWGVNIPDESSKPAHY